MYGSIVRLPADSSTCFHRSVACKTYALSDMSSDAVTATKITLSKDSRKLTVYRQCFMIQ